MNNPKREFAPLLQVFPHGFVAIDLETTGLSPLIDRIIEIAGIKVKPEGTEVWNELINPGVEIPPFTIDIHGISQDMVADCPDLKSRLPDFLNFIEDLPLIAHNAKFDVGFILFSQHQLGFPMGKNEVYCTVKASRKAFPEMPNHKLGTLAQELDLALENHHRAKDDALACLEVFNKAIERGEQQGTTKRILKDSYLFNLQDFKKNAMEKLPEHIEVLSKKAERQTVVDIKYKGGSYKGQFRPIKPVSLLPMPEGHILYALCMFTNLYKSFALSKIQAVKELNAEEISQRHKALEKSLKNS